MSESNESKDAGVIDGIPLKRCPPGSMLSLHYELAFGEYSFGKVRFCQSLNHLAFWTSVTRPDGEHVLYKFSLQDLADASLQLVGEIEYEARAQHPKQKNEKP